MVASDGKLCWLYDGTLFVYDFMATPQAKQATKTLPIEFSLSGVHAEKSD